MPPRLSRLIKYALRSLPSATTRWGGVAPDTSTSNGPELPKATSGQSTQSQLARAQESLGSPVEIGPGWNRITASPPSQIPPVLKVLRVVTNGFFPSLATPPTAHIPPRDEPP